MPRQDADHNQVTCCAPISEHGRSDSERAPAPQTRPRSSHYYPQVIKKKVGLAFLSACEAATRDEKLPGEAVHLAAGMIVTSLPAVIGTMWSIKEQDAPLVPKEVYARLVDGIPDAKGAAQVLHVAVGRLRDKVGDKEFARWVPYIHIGI